MSAARGRLRRILARILRIVRPVLFGLLGLVVLLAVSLLFAPTRGLLLKAGLRIADAALPGSMTVQEAAWPRGGHLVLEDLLWVAGDQARPDTLVDLGRLDLAVDLAALRAREGRVDSLVVDLRRLDVPALAAAFGPDSTATPDTARVEEDGGSAAVPWLEAGPVPGLPALAVGRLSFRGGRLDLAEGLSVDAAAVEARLEAGSGGRPEAEIGHLAGRVRGTMSGPEGDRAFGLELSHLGAGCRLDPASTAAGDLRGADAVLDSLEVRLASLSLDSTLAATGIALSASGTVEEGSRVRLTLSGLSGEARGRAADGNGWEAVLTRLGLTAAVEATPGADGTWVLESAALEDIDLAAGPARLENRMTVEDVALRAGASMGRDRPWRLRVEHLQGTVAGTGPAGDGGEAWGVALTHLGLGAEVLVDTTAAGALRLAGADLDSLNLRLATTGPLADRAGWNPDEPLHLDASGRVAREGTTYSADVAVDFLLPGTANFPALLPEGFPHEAFGALAGRLTLDGSYDDPRVVADLDLDLRETAWLDNGRAVLHVDADRDQLAAGDLTDLVVQADSLALGLYGTGLMLDGGIDRGDLDLRLVLGTDDARLLRAILGSTAESDTLAVGADLAVAGDLGKPQVNGFLQGTARLEEFDLEVPSFRLDLAGDARRVDAALRAGGGLAFGSTRLDSVVASVSGTRDSLGALGAGLALELWSRPFHLGLGGEVAGDTVRTARIDSLWVADDQGRFELIDPVTLTMGPEAGEFALTPLIMSGDPGEITLEGRWTAEQFAVAGTVDLLLKEGLLQRVAPGPLWGMDGGVDLALDAAVDLSGTPETPGFTGYSRARLIPHRDNPSLGLDLDFSLARGDTAGLFAKMAILSADTLLLEGSALWPGRADLGQGVWIPDQERSLRVEIPTTRLAVQRFNRLLPEDVGLNGTLEIGAELEVPVVRPSDGPQGRTQALESSSLAAALKSRDVRVSLPNRSRIELALDLAAEGSLAEPVLRGRVDVSSAFFRIPEIPRTLHPVEGPSLLWAMRDSALALLDSTAVLADSFAVFANPENPYGLQPTGPAFLPDLDLKIVFPSKVRVNGYGMDIELEGDVHVARGYDKDGLPGPSLTGTVRVRSGSIQFMNRVFNPRRGNVEFTGDVPPNPYLDMLIEATVSGTLVKILVSGRANDPVIDLTSEPEMPEEDVMAVLLFGRPLNDLDTGQRDHVREEGDPAQELRENLAGLAMVFGTAGLQNRMSNTLGVDMVQLGADSSGGSTLMVGKFISPELVVKYQASLEKSGTYFMTLEYTLSRYFKVVSTYGQGEEASGAELQWSRRY